VHITSVSFKRIVQYMQSLVHEMLLRILPFKD